jgi:hypothetical protein
VFWRRRLLKVADWLWQILQTDQKKQQQSTSILFSRHVLLNELPFTQLALFLRVDLIF